MVRGNLFGALEWEEFHIFFSAFVDADWSWLADHCIDHGPNGLG